LLIPSPDLMQTRNNDRVELYLTWQVVKASLASRLKANQEAQPGNQHE
jgi:hypothetical protein